LAQPLYDQLTAVTDEEVNDVMSTVYVHPVCMYMYVDACSGYECSAGEQCKLDDWRRPTCVCRTLCSYDYKPVCANDGRTYSNECVMNAEACKSRVQLRLVHSGECTASAGAFSHVTHAPSNRLLSVSQTPFMLRFFVWIFFL